LGLSQGDFPGIVVSGLQPEDFWEISWEFLGAISWGDAPRFDVAVLQPVGKQRG